jgi:hypothetical protein
MHGRDEGDDGDFPSLKGCFGSPNNVRHVLYDISASCGELRPFAKDILA